MFVGFVFFFQAEDGIRDLVRSRGLGDVYKRQLQQHAQELRGAPGRHERVGDLQAEVGRTDRAAVGQHGRQPVSYTHLTLPTSDLV